MPFTVEEVTNVANAALDFHIERGKVLAQSLQARPLLKWLRDNQKTFPGGKELIIGRVKGDYTTQFLGYSHDDQVGYGNPTNIKSFSFPWYEMHAGISFSYSELKKDGLSVVDSLNGEETTEHTDREQTALANILEDKLDDMSEGADRSFNNTCFLDGAQDAKVFPGLLYLLSGTPTTGTMGGIDRASNTWWRNRAKTGSTKITSSTSLQTLTKTLRSEVRQMRRYGGMPSGWFAGSTFIEKLEAEIFEKGTYTQEGFIKRGTNEIGMADISMRGVGTCVYEPTFDDQGYGDYAVFLDPKNFFLNVMDGEDMKKHAPARPHDRYAFYKALTWTGAEMVNKLNSHGLFQTA